ncbi:serine protease ami-like [Spea bombifrons]|uniref:serine protease ami-like n=1 Tax=Spea bombifrons TaxID=233779 RepID=UPI002349A799|nr:serine protease ami-like [Spea bombifrons]
MRQISKTMNVLSPWSLLFAFLSVIAVECAPRGRILGGRDSSSNDRPYMVSVQLDGAHHCGGLLISDQWVLSAAHCAAPSNKTLRVMLGSNSLKESSKYKLEYDVKTQIVYPLYNSSRKHDLLLLQLPQTIPLSNAVKPLPYQMEDIDIPEGTRCLVAGWGQIKLTGKRPDMLQELEVPVISNERCNRRDYYDDEITEFMMCAGENKKDSCEGDSGGPLVCNGIAEGIVSGGHRKCGNAKKPGIYTRIAPYKTWIQEAIYNTTLLHTTTAPPM